MVRDLNEGRLDTTGNAPFDLAINGKGYFVVQTAAGDRYTRNGHLTLNGDGELVTDSGDPIMGDGGADHRHGRRRRHPHRRRRHGQRQAGPDRQAQAGRLRQRARAAEGRRRASIRPTRARSAVDKPNILQGTLETSNVEPVIEISHMIDVMRAYQATATLAQSAGRPEAPGHRQARQRRRIKENNPCAPSASQRPECSPSRPTSKSSPTIWRT